MIYPTTIIEGEDGHTMAVHLLTEDRVEVFVDGQPVVLSKTQFDTMVSWVNGHQQHIKAANSKVLYPIH